MADKKISELAGASTPIAGTEVLPIVQSGTTSKVSASDLTAGRRIDTAGMDANIGGSAHGVKITGITGANQDFYAVRDGSSNVQEGPNITLQSATGTTYATTIQMGPTGDLLFFIYDGSSWNQRVTITSAGNVKINTSGQGIDFSATSGTGTSELLDDYEEGTWQAVISDGTTDATMAATFCTYTKIGRQVTLTGYIATSDITGITGALIITGLPFAAQATGQFYAANTAGLGGGLALGAGQSVAMLVQPGGSHINLYVWGAVAGGTTGLFPAGWTADGAIAINLTYFVA